MKYVIIENNECIFVDDKLNRLKDTLEFLPQYSEEDIISIDETELEMAFNGKWYIKGYAPQQPIEEKQEQVREVRNSYLVEYVDPYQLILRWEALSEDQKIDIINYRQYLLDYTKEENWYEQNPLTLAEWKEQNK